jgi:hypothetical protein
MSADAATATLTDLDWGSGCRAGSSIGPMAMLAALGVITITRMPVIAVLILATTSYPDRRGAHARRPRPCRMVAFGGRVDRSVCLRADHPCIAAQIPELLSWSRR